MYTTIAIGTGPSTHLDHLGVLSSLLEIPLVVSDESVYLLAKKYYPELQVHLKDPTDISLEFLSRFDKILQCGQFWATELPPLIELLYGKRVRMVFCPHGNSDKGHSAEKLPRQDIALAYGPQMADLFEKKRGECNSLILTGNYRLPYYRKQQSFYDAIAEKEVFSRLDPQKRTILYAPSWNDGENLSSFFEAAERAAVQITSHFNLIIKLHPFLEEELPAETEYLLSLFEKIPRCVALKAFPPVYPLLAKVSAYLGDYSSVGYDFLAFDRPLFFLTPPTNSHLLHECGLCIPKDAAISAFIDNHWEENQSNFSPMRHRTYLHAFGTEKTVSELKTSILSTS